MKAEKLISPSTKTLNKIKKSTESEVYLISGISRTYSGKLITENEKVSIDFLDGDEFESFSVVLNHWRNTREYRQNIFGDKDRNLSGLLGQFKCLTIPFAHVLVGFFFQSI